MHYLFFLSILIFLLDKDTFGYCFDLRLILCLLLSWTFMYMHFWASFFSNSCSCSSTEIRHHWSLCSSSIIFMHNWPSVLRIRTNVTHFLSTKTLGKNHSKPLRLTHAKIVYAFIKSKKQLTKQSLQQLKTA